MGTSKAAVYFASDEAQRRRHYQEGQRIDLDSIACVSRREIAPGFWQVELDSTGRSYLHVSEEAD